jgi:hypothetical protein
VLRLVANAFGLSLMPARTMLSSDMLRYEELSREVREKDLRVTKKKYQIITCSFIGNKYSYYLHSIQTLLL